MHRKPAGINKSSQAGTTLAEVLVVMILLVILVVVAVPSWKSYTERQHLKGAAQALMSDLTLMRSEAVAKNSTVTIRFQTGATWCYGLSDNPAQTCSCQPGGTGCTLNGVQKVNSWANFKNVQLVSTTFTNQTTGFEPVRGMAVSGGTVVFQSTSGQQVRVELNPVGRIRGCASQLPPFSPC
ncbi:MAG: hypothetical protein G8345_18920 [Magnetococcales bacterium]|nr:GspH/FimT family pseudopilin [Magnetococcales bacterium]NGZ28947.1 hypothetical protein [Magnetococcales bacterium]